MKCTCYVCGHRTLDSRCDFDICPVCFWEDDVYFDGEADKSSSANAGLSISQVQANFMLFGACARNFIAKVRAPVEGEDRVPDWRPIDAATAIFERSRS